MINDTATDPEKWSKWVHQNSQGMDPQALQAHQEMVLQKVCLHAEIAQGDIVLDVGTGAGLIGFGALPLVGEQGKVIFSDTSTELLETCRSVAEDMGVLARCEFLQASAEDLSALPDSSVDVVTLKAVLVAVREKQQAFQEFYRVLRPGGRLYLEEPINRFGWPEPETQFWGYDVSPIQDLAARVRQRRESPPARQPACDSNGLHVHRAGVHGRKPALPNARALGASHFSLLACW